MSAVFSKNLRRVDFQDFSCLLQLFTADSSLLQTTVCVNTTPHTSIFHDSHAHAGLKFGSALIPSHPCFMRIVVVESDCSLSLRQLHSPLLVHHLLSDHPVLPSARELHLPGCGGQIPCALPLRTLGPLPSTSLTNPREKARCKGSANTN